MGASLLKAGRRFDDAANTVVLASYTTVDLYVDYALAQDWSLQAKLNNAGDRVYETAKGYNQPGRAFYVTLRYAPR